MGANSVGYDPVNFTDPSGRSLKSLVSAFIYGNFVALTWTIPALNYVLTGDLSYDWTQETWEQLGIVAASVGAGFACGSVAGPIAGGACAGAVGSGLSAAVAGGGVGDVLLASTFGAAIGGATGQIGLLASLGTFSATTNPFVHATVAASSSAAVNIGIQTVQGDGIDWGQVGVQAGISGMQAFYRASQVEAAQAERARRLEAIRNLFAGPQQQRAGLLACGADCYLPNPMYLPDVTPEFNQAYQEAMTVGRGAAVFGPLVPAFVAELLGLEFAAAAGAAGLTTEAAEAAFIGMRGGGGHAMRKLIAEGLIPDAGSLASRVQAMRNLLSPVLQSPTHTFSWRVGATEAMGYIGQAGGRDVFVFIATQGSYAGRVISSGVVSASDWALWGLIP